MLVLTMSKRALYSLALYYTPLPLLRQVTYAEDAIDPIYTLDWVNAYGVNCTATLRIIDGVAHLAIRKLDGGKELCSSDRALSLPALRDYGLVREVFPGPGVIPSKYRRARLSYPEK